MATDCVTIEEKQVATGTEATGRIAAAQIDRSYSPGGANVHPWAGKVCRRPRHLDRLIRNHWRSQGEGGGGTPPPPKLGSQENPGCAVEINTQNCAWFGSQMSLITAMSFREAVPPPNHPPGALPLDPAGGLPFPRPPVPPTSKS